MGILIRNNNDDIKGMKIKENNYLLFQYADDTGIFLDGSEKSLKKTLDLLEQFSKYSGLTPNFDKTKAIWIGSKAHSNERLCRDRKLIWTDENFDILGITYTTILDNIEIINYKKKCQELESRIKQWQKRKISVLGKITVVKTLLVPILTHLFIVIPKPDQSIIKKN